MAPTPQAQSPARPDRGRWLRPPVLRASTADPEARGVSGIELLFDLVFVVAVDQAASILDLDVSLDGLGWFAGVLLLVVWSWLNMVFYTQRFDADDALHRATKGAAMVAVAALAVTAPYAPAGDPVPLALSFLAVRIVLLAFYARAYRHVPQARRPLAIYMLAFATGTLLFDSTAAAPRWLWPPLLLGGALIELAVPFQVWRALDRATASGPHLQQRLGQFTMIVLGDVVTRVVRGATLLPTWNTAAWLVTGGAAALVLALWWIDLDVAQAPVPPGLRSLAHIYVRLPIFGALAATGVGLAHAIRHAADATLPARVRWTLAGSLATYLAALAIARLVQRQRERAGLDLLAAAVLLLVGLIGARLGPPVVMGLVLLVVVLRHGSSGLQPR